MTNSPSKRDQSKNYQLVIGGIICTLLVAWLAYSTGQGNSIADELAGQDSSVTSQVASPMHVEVIAAGSVPAPVLHRRYRGTIRPRRDSELAFRRSGRIETITVSEGDAVKTGDVIATLNVADLQSRLDQATAARNSAKAVLNEAIAGPRQQTIDAAAAETRRLEAQLASAKNQQDRQIKLLRRGAGTDQAVDDLRFEVDRLDAQWKAARLRWDELQEGTRVEQVEAARAALAMAEAAIGQIQVDFSDSQIVAPFDGLIASRMVDEGRLATQLETAVRVVEAPPYEARFGLPADLAGSLSLHQIIPIQIDNDDPIDSTIVRIHPTIDLATRTQAIDVRLPADAPLVVGQTVSAMIQPAAVQSTSNRFWVPTEALVRGSRGLWSVMVVTDSDSGDTDYGIVERRNVRALRTNGALSEVAGMIQPNDRIIASGTHRLGPGVKVQAVDWDVRSLADGDSAEQTVR